MKLKFIKLIEQKNETDYIFEFEDIIFRVWMASFGPQIRFLESGYIPKEAVEEAFEYVKYLQEQEK